MEAVIELLDDCFEIMFDFTVIGPAVNLVARIEGLNRDLVVPLVYSADFAMLWDGKSRSLGFHDLKGIAAPQEAFILAEKPLDEGAR